METHPRSQTPDEIAHILAVNEGEPVRIYLERQSLTIPVEPYRNGTPKTETKPVASFEAVIESMEIADGGLNLAGFGGLHLPESEWDRVGLQEHWEAEDVDLTSPTTSASRRLEVWGSREDNFYSTEEDEYTDTHLEPIPDDSPLITEWNTYSDDAVEYPPVAFDRPSVYVYAIHSEESDHDSHGMDRIEVGEIGAVEVLDGISEWPEEPDIEKESLDLEASKPSRHPEIDFGELDGLEPSEEMLEALFAVNRWAKKLSEKADMAYQYGDGAEARVHSVRKEALYRVKTIALHRLMKSGVDVELEKHRIDGREYWCFYFDDYSFHQPPDAVVGDVLEEFETDGDSQVIEFEGSSDVSEVEVSLEDALCRLADAGVNANEQLQQRVVEDYAWGSLHRTEWESIEE